MLGMVNIWRWGLPALTAVFLGTSVYSVVDLSHERQQARNLSATNSSLRASLGQMQNELEVVSNRLNQLETQPPARVAPAKPEPHVRPKARIVANVRPIAPRPSTPPQDDPRWSDVQSRLSEQQQQLNKTREDLEGKLNSTHDELSGSIAKNHEEFVALQKRGERNYYEFQIDKSKLFQKVGPLNISLRKVNQKHKYYDVAVIVDDQQLEKKHVNLYEPMMLSTTDRPQPIELVVNQIHGNLVKGYISEPKYTKAELALTYSHEEKPKGLQQR